MTIDELRNSGCILLECISGSRAYNLHTENSDTDIKGVFYLPKEIYFGLEYIPQISNETNDVVFYELGRFVELLLNNNPNMLELLVSPTDCIVYRNPILDVFTPALFLSKMCKDTFANFAISQIKKAKGLNKKINNPIDEKRKTIMDFCFVIDENKSQPLKTWLKANDFHQEKCGLSKIPNTKGMYALYYDHHEEFNFDGIIRDENSNDVSLSSIPKAINVSAHLFCNLDSYSIYCKEYREYWSWIEKRNEVRYQTNMNHSKKYDAKNMMHTIRLLQMALEIISEQKINVRRSNREELLAIKNGEMEYDDILEMADTLIDKIEGRYLNCSLPDEPNKHEIVTFLVQIRNDLYF